MKTAVTKKRSTSTGSGKQVERAASSELRPGKTAAARRFLAVVYEDDALVGVAKPAGIDMDASGAGAVTGLRELLEVLRGPETLEPVNRLARFESGVVLFARTREMLEYLKEGWASGKVAQEFEAVVRGPMRESRVLIDPRHGQSRGQGRKASGGSARGGGRSGATAKQIEESGTVVDRAETWDRRVLARCRTYVENTHALKAQLRAAGLRVIGDPVGDRFGREKPEQTALHLERVTFHHPRLKRRVTIRAGRADFERMLRTGHDVERLLWAALVRRLRLLVSREATAYRLLTAAEYLPGLTMDRFGDVGVVEVRAEELGRLGRMETGGTKEAPVPGTRVKRSDAPDASDGTAFLKRVARFYGGVLGLAAVYGRVIGKSRSAGIESGPLVGASVGSEVAIRENGLVYGIRPGESSSVGLYLDQRENRLRLRRLAAGKAVLNLFAYTCGFSVAAAAGGAAGTVSVDISTRHLEWGKRNFEWNNLPLDGHRFIRSDALSYFERARRQGRTFDIVVIDPPTFAHGRRGEGTFQIERDLRRVVAGAFEVLREGGMMLVSSNCRTVTTGWLVQQVRSGARGRAFRVWERPDLPEDFRADGRFAHSVWIAADQ